MIAFIPGLCPLDDIIIFLLAPALLVWLHKTCKWCRKSCKCDCHDKPKSRSAWFRWP